MWRSSFVVACLVLFLGGVSAAESGSVVWTSRYMGDYSGYAQGLACRGNRVFTAGQVWPTGEFDKDRFVVTAHNSNTGELLWADTGEEGSLAASVKYGFGRVFAAGTRKTGIESSPLFVKAYNPSKGTPVWEALWTGSSSAIANANDIAVASYMPRLFVAGYTTGSDQSEGYFTVLALNSANGNLVWQQSEQSSGDAQPYKGNARAIVENSGRVIAVGAFRDETNFREGFVVRAYNATTGRLLWEDVQWPVNKGIESAYLRSYATAVTAASSRVYAAGSMFDADGGGTFTVRAYSAATGKLIWQDMYNHFSYFHDAAQTVTLQGSRLFVGGFVTRASAGRAYVVRAYDAAKGNLLWSSMLGGYDIEENWVSALTAVGTTIYATGTSRNGTAFTVRAYNRTTGDLLWENFLPQEEATEGLGDAAAVCAVSNGIVAGGASTQDAGGDYGFTLRAYSVR